MKQLIIIYFEINKIFMNLSYKMFFKVVHRFLTLVKSLEEVDGLGEVVVPDKVDDVLDEHSLILDGSV